MITQTQFKQGLAKLNRIWSYLNDQNMASETTVHLSSAFREIEIAMNAVRWQLY